jgi:hypothetical protein
VFSSVGIDDEFTEKLKEILLDYPGQTKVYMKISTPKHKESIIETPVTVKITDKLFKELQKLLGENSWEIIE